MDVRGPGLGGTQIDVCELLTGSFEFLLLNNTLRQKSCLDLCLALQLHVRVIG